MKETRDPFSPFGVKLWFDRGEIDEICLDALLAANVLPSEPKPVEIDLFIERHFACDLVIHEDLGESVLGFTRFATNGRVEAIAADRKLFEAGKSGERRGRSTLAHEAGHGLLHSTLFMTTLNANLFPQGTFDPSNRRILCRDVDIFGAKPYNGRWWEVQANQAIGGLLLPTLLVRRAVEPFVTRRGLDGSLRLERDKRAEAATALSSIFEVNPKVVEIRLNTLFPVQPGQLEL